MYRLRQCLRNSCGFSLIEIISVILMLGILAALIIPLFNTTSFDIETAAQSVRSDLRFMQQLALSRNPTTGGELGIVFNPGASTYTVSDPQGTFNQTRTFSGVTIQSVSIPSAPVSNALSFNRWGEPEFDTATTFATIVLDAAGLTRTISVERYTGRVSIS